MAIAGHQYYDTPWMAAYTPDGERQFVWSPPGPHKIRGSINSLAWSSDGRLLAVATEAAASDEPSTPGPVCNPDDCRGLAVHVFDPTGELSWSYERRQFASWGEAAAWAPNGDVLAGGHEEGRGALLLRFVPPG